MQRRVSFSPLVSRPVFACSVCARAWIPRYFAAAAFRRLLLLPPSPPRSLFLDGTDVGAFAAPASIRGTTVVSRDESTPESSQSTRSFRNVFRNVPLANAPARARWIAKAPRRREGGDEGERRRDKEGRETERKSGRHGASRWVNRTISTEIGKEERKLEGPAAGDVRRRETECVRAGVRVSVRA